MAAIWICATAVLCFGAGWTLARLARGGSTPSSVAPVATVTHELRTPITGVVGMTDLLLATDLSPEQVTYIRAIRGSAETMQAIVGDLLDAAALEAGQFRQTRQPFAPDALVEEIVELLAPHAQAKGLELAGHVAPETPVLVAGDPQRLRQILINLVGNAVKYTSHGGVGLRVDPTPLGMAFAIHDTGPGIAESDMTRLFQRFERGTDTRASGTGLGLSIARHLAEKLGGRLDLHSVMGRGSTFTVTLPLDVERMEDAPENWLAKASALIAAQSPFEGPWLAERLEQAGAGVALAPTADLVRRAVTEASWSIVFADGIMRFEAADALAEAAMAGARIIHLITPAERRAIGTPGEYLMRPVRAQSLREVLTRSAPLPTAEDMPAAAPEGPTTARPRALLAEDDGVNALLARTRLERAGWRVTTVSDGLGAVSAFRAACEHDPFELAILDLEMPGQSGFDAAAAIRAIETQHGKAPVPVVVVTAADIAPLQDSARTHGVDAVICKPLDPDILARVLPDGVLQRAG